MTTDKGIFIQNIYYMLSYAYQELQQQEIPFREHMETGIMIETPAAAINSLQRVFPGS